jgi:rubrerythrin
MTREEAIKLIEHISIAFVPTDQYGDYDDPQPYEEALDIAIEALKAEPSTEGRYEKAIKTLQEMPRYLNNVRVKQIKKVSTNTVQGKWIKHKGKWVDFDFYPTKYECSQCHYYVDEGRDSIFCPNCGAKMKGGVE